MVLVVGMALLGIVLGVSTARRRKGSTADIAQYAAGYGIAFALIGLIASLVVVRMIA
ncbi:MAG: hypothetical protein AAF496_03320 [Pseudomonadota bacterium]